MLLFLTIYCNKTAPCLQSVFNFNDLILKLTTAVLISLKAVFSLIGL